MTVIIVKLPRFRNLLYKPHRVVRRLAAQKVAFKLLGWKWWMLLVWNKDCRFLTMQLAKKDTSKYAKTELFLEKVNLLLVPYVIKPYLLPPYPYKYICCPTLPWSYSIFLTIFQLFLNNICLSNVCIKKSCWVGQSLSSSFSYYPAVFFFSPCLSPEKETQGHVFLSFLSTFMLKNQKIAQTHSLANNWTGVSSRWMTASANDTVVVSFASFQKDEGIISWLYIPRSSFITNHYELGSVFKM